MDIKIIVATHKEYDMPQDDMYLPVQNGAVIDKRLPYQSDAQGDNISSKKVNYCELTSLYWAWKNLNAEYMGLCHYRRFLGKKCPMTKETAERLLTVAPIVLPKKSHYFIESNYSQYVHAHNEIDLIKTRLILETKYPDYLQSYDIVMNKTSGHRCNIFLMRRDILNEYCTWLFDILFELENQIDTSNYNEYDQRVFGLVAERLLDVWLEQKRYQYIEYPIYYSEKVHWIKKGLSFIKRKYKKH